ncbi:MAG: hypothetical protein MJ252_23250 [archaeon]|nr:hypothetical protein [archaeon]
MKKINNRINLEKAIFESEEEDEPESEEIDEYINPGKSNKKKENNEDNNPKHVNLWDLGDIRPKTKNLHLFEDPDLDDAEEEQNFREKKGYKRRQLSLPSQPKKENKSQKNSVQNSAENRKNSSDNKNRNNHLFERVYVPKKPIKKKRKGNHSIDDIRKRNLNLNFNEYQDPDKVIQFYKNKCNERHVPPANVNPNNPKKKGKNTEKIGQNLYNKKTFSVNFELQNKMKKKHEEEKEKKEMEECTFKPKLYSNNLYLHNQGKAKVINDEKKDIYNRQNQWLNNREAKIEKNLQMQQEREFEDCSFNPKINKMPNFNNQSAKTKYYAEKDLYLSRMKKEKKMTQEMMEKSKVKDFVKDYDERRKKETMGMNNVRSQINFNYENDLENEDETKEIIGMYANKNNSCFIKKNDLPSTMNLNRQTPNIVSNPNLSSTTKKPIGDTLSKNSSINKFNNKNNDLEFQMQKEMLKNELMNWNNDEEEEDHDYEEDEDICQ